MFQLRNRKGKWHTLFKGSYSQLNMHVHCLRTESDISFINPSF